ncbi:MAG: serine/threonine protein kinase [Pirellulales bacterium]|nr:serine/threonine protein kinase [Pirellulales bacterium]
MGEQTAEQIAHRVVEVGLLDDRQMQAAWGEFGRTDATPDEFLQFLVRRELLTNYQVTRLLNGERGGYFYGDYKVLYLVSAGSFARVYRAVDRRNGRVVAIKLLRRRFADNQEQTEQFVREGEMGRTLRHPNIVPIYEVYSKGANHFLVMEFVEGHNLRDFLKIRKKIDPPEATRMLVDIASGLNYAHGRGVCHRDLKLTNVLVSSRGQARLIDFGLAGGDLEDNEEELETAANPRTIDYAGLERATGVRKDDPRSDIYFLGCIYYYILTGKSPLQETKDRIQRLSRQRYMDVKPIHRIDPDLPRVVALLVNKSMELDADKRYQTLGQMLVDLNIAYKRLLAGGDKQETAADLDSDAGKETVAASDEERNRLTAMLIPEHQRRVLMFVESNIRMQDIFRDGMKRCGYRVLLTSDPQRAIGRLKENAKSADCVIFSSGDIGQSALEAFNEFGQCEETKHIPAVLLLGEKQSGWREHARIDKQHRLIAMPIKLKELRSVLTQLVPPLPGEAAATGAANEN